MNKRQHFGYEHTEPHSEDGRTYLYSPNIGEMWEVWFRGRKMGSLKTRAEARIHIRSLKRQACLDEGMCPLEPFKG